MISNYALKIIIIAEFTLVILLIIFAYLLKLYFSLKVRNKNICKYELEKYLNKLIKEKTEFVKKMIRRRWRKVEIMLPVIDKFEKKRQQGWLNIRDKLLAEILLPIARKNAYSTVWLKRYMAVKCFLHKVEENDQEIVIDLLSDRVPIVAINAIPLAFKLKSTRAIEKIIKNIAAERRLSQTVFLREFEGSQEVVFPIIKKMLHHEKDPYIRATCYRLIKIFPKKYYIGQYIKKDIKSKVLELKLTAIRSLTHAPKSQAEPILNALLKNKVWQVRVAAIQSLGDFKDPKYIFTITSCLEDPTWWVRFNAANALKKYGERGIKILSSLDPEKDLYAFEAAQHVLQVDHPHLE